MKQLALIRHTFESRWMSLLPFQDEIVEDSKNDWSRFRDRLDDLIVATFWEVFEQAKTDLQPKPSRFARFTVQSWADAAERQLWVLPEVLWGNYDCNDRLLSLDEIALNELQRTDLVYRPEAMASLETVEQIPARSPALRRVASEMHPHLVRAVQALLSGFRCSTVEEAVQNHPVLKGIDDSELTRLRGNRAFSEGTAARELLTARLPRLCPSTVERYFRPKPFRTG